MKRVHFRNIKLSKRSPTRKTTCCVTSFICSSRAGWLEYGDGTANSGCLCRGFRKGRVTRELFEKMDFLHLIHLFQTHFSVCTLYFNLRKKRNWGAITNYFIRGLWELNKLIQWYLGTHCVLTRKNGSALGTCSSHLLELVWVTTPPARENVSSIVPCLPLIGLN